MWEKNSVDCERTPSEALMVDTDFHREEKLILICLIYLLSPQIGNFGLLDLRKATKTSWGPR